MHDFFHSLLYTEKGAVLFEVAMLAIFVGYLMNWARSHPASCRVTLNVTFWLLSVHMAYCILRFMLTGEWLRVALAAVALLLCFLAIRRTAR